MDLGIQGRVATVAASSSGLGLAVARTLVEEGVRVAICGRDADRLARAREELEELASSPDDVLAVSVNLSDPAGPSRFLEEVSARLGPVDILVVNNGGPPPGRVLDVREEDWEQGVEQTLLGSIRLARQAAPAMAERGWGRVIFITSTSVLQPIPDLAISTAMRSGVVGFAKCLSDELASRGVTVNTVAPGATGTDRLHQILRVRAREDGISEEAARETLTSMIPAGRIGEPAEFAAAVAFLASQRASYITGTVLAVDGGQVRGIT